MIITADTSAQATGSPPVAAYFFYLTAVFLFSNIFLIY
jgi:hypothetical protein